jgi:uncharacterized membrane protein
VSKEKLTDILITDEQVREQRIHELLKARKSLNINAEMSKTLTIGQRLSDKVASFTGTWSFLIIFTAIIIIWGIINTEWLLSKPFDPFPYVFLNLVLACISSMQAPIIMMSQNRESQKDRLRAENDYLINQKSEIILEDLHLKIDELMSEQKRLKKQLNDIMISINGRNAIDGKTDDSLRSVMDGKVDTYREEQGLYDRDNRTH